MLAIAIGILMLLIDAPAISLFLPSLFFDREGAAQSGPASLAMLDAGERAAIDP